jgi:hypothetical protein
MLVEHDQIVEDAHHRPLGQRVDPIEDRQVWRAVPDMYLEDPAGLLRQCIASARYCQQPETDCKQMSFAHHFRLPVQYADAFFGGNGLSIGLSPAPRKKLVEARGLEIESVKLCRAMFHCPIGAPRSWPPRCEGPL